MGGQNTCIKEGWERLLDFHDGGNIVGNTAEREDSRWRLDEKDFGSV
jgi:hypothetical protein